MTSRGEWGAIERDTVMHLVHMVEAHGELEFRLPNGTESLSYEEVLMAVRNRVKSCVPILFPGENHQEQVQVVEELEALHVSISVLGRARDQSEYESVYQTIQSQLEFIRNHLCSQRFMMGSSDEDLSYADCLLFSFLVRLDSVYFDLFKATFFCLRDHPALWEYCCDLYERPEFYSVTDVVAIRDLAYRSEPDLNPRGLVPQGGVVDFHSPHFRHKEFGDRSMELEQAGTEETQRARQEPGEWVRPQSKLRRAIAEGSEFPPEAGRYHLFAPYNCPWSHRTLLGREVKGLQDIVGASIVYFRRDADHGWQFNPRIPGCTKDGVGGRKFLSWYYETAGSEERSAPVLWDTKTNQIVSNESADILRIFNDAFSELLPAEATDLYPAPFRSEIGQLNELIYQRINNGAYKAGFATSQPAYERACGRYFSAWCFLEKLLERRDFLLDTPHPTEVDLRLFPTIFRHDAIYFARFKLNVRRVADSPRIAAWMENMLAWPGIASASNLDHARNGYFGRTGNGIVPYGPTPLGLSPANFSRAEWLNS